ncbi:hypothetical protein ER308_09490 [Egibacter rhizosphaerae]|uniref:DUF4015 domain-containing protein n=1 Tax=Egibacter rhizosphaerae TaxID=1670831 RepID=A0A411YF01_9ACTN|nr:putative glycoside hydrolase [Egibacter rhizosphaerae]QBI19761.1 hypothetical protein ER308_09490 [Egibacter rhizosphaerae]
MRAALIGVLLVGAAAAMAWWWNAGATDAPLDVGTGGEGEAPDSDEAGVELALRGLDDGDVVTAEDLEEGLDVTVVGEPAERVQHAAVRRNGARQHPFDEDGEVPLDLDRMPEGEQVIEVEVPETEDAPAAEASWSFTLDTRPPPLRLEDPDLAVGDEPVGIAGSTDPDAEVEVGGEPVEVDEDGEFATELEVPQDGAATVHELTVTATSEAGNTATAEAEAAWVPSRSDVERIRGVHVSPHGWASDELREGVLTLAEEGRINTVVLSLKDEGGHVGYDTDLELANEIGANLAVYDLDDTVAELHERGIRVVGRIVAFADPTWAPHAWENGDRDVVVQRPEGVMHTGSYDGFTSFAHEDVRQYQIDLAVEAARAGVDDILWDYIRRPDGPLDEYHFGGLDEDTTPSESIVDFLEEADEAIAPYGTSHGASVYGIAATRPHEIAQDIPAMSEHLDYVAPMVYYSHWGPGEFDVSDPNAEPGLITERSLEEFVRLAEEQGDSHVVAWLQDFQLGGPHGESEVRAQLEAAERAGVDEWMMWNASVRYTRSAYDPLEED